MHCNLSTKEWSHQQTLYSSRQNKTALAPYVYCRIQGCLVLSMTIQMYFIDQSLSCYIPRQEFRIFHNLCRIWIKPLHRAMKTYYFILACIIRLLVSVYFPTRCDCDVRSVAFYGEDSSEDKMEFWSVYEM